MTTTTPTTWPESLRQIADQVSDAAAAALVQHYGGRKVSIPSQPTLIHPLVDLVGIEAFGKLCWLLGGSQITVPLCRRAERQARNDKIWAARQAGAKIGDLAQEFDLSYRTILEVLARYK